VRTHKGATDECFNCVYQREDEVGKVGVSLLARELMAVAGDALKTNITTLGPLVLPLSEQLKFLKSLMMRRVFRVKGVRPYIPDFRRAFEHFCVHAGGRAVLEEVQRSLSLQDTDIEPSKYALHRFGNTSSSSLWYELAYAEAKGRVQRGHHVWQIGFGSGFKCNSAVWRALRDVHTDMALRALYARDFHLMWQRLRRGTRRDVPLSLVLGRVAWQVLRNRMGMSPRSGKSGNENQP